MYYAHSAKNIPQAEWHRLAVHLLDVAAKSSEFAAPFNSQKAAWLCGALHDIGKYSQAFQKRLRGGKRVDHSLAGALEADAYWAHSPLGKLFAHIISAHHTGLANGANSGDSQEESGSTLCERMAQARNIPDYAAWRQEIALPPCPSPQEIFPLTASPAALYFWCKMLFSCLVDADFLDTEQALNQAKASSRGGYPGIAQLDEALEAYLANKTTTAPLSLLNRRRNEVLAACRNAAEKDKGLFSLTVPTGGGKTLSSLAFALNHARRNDLTRVIYVIPYTSIIEQTADVFRKAFGGTLAHAVVEHHCNAYVEKENKIPAAADDTEDPRTLAWENWDAPVIVTTSVQFYESLFAARSSACRKLHNIANSVVILDEAQTLPLRYLRPCLAALDQLVSHYNTSIVLCTATQPKVQKAPWLREGLSNVREIIDAPEQLFNDLKRVSVCNIGKVPDAELLAALAQHSQALCIVNTRKHARALCEQLIVQGHAPFHLSTWMYPQHRRQRLNKIRECLQKGEPCVVIATSLIEAGVDISFPVVYRAVSGVDSIAQAAGRCNREQEVPLGYTYVFEPEEKARGEQDRRIKSGKKILEAYGDILLPEAVAAYFNELYALEGASNLDAKNILAAITRTADAGFFPFRSVANDFTLIEEQTLGVLVACDDDDEAKKAIERLKSTPPDRNEARKLQQWTVSLRKREWEALRAARVIAPYGFGDSWYVLTNNDLYNETFGLDTREPTKRHTESNIA